MPEATRYRSPSHALLTLGIAALGLGSSGDSAFAQEEGETIEEIRVTGSRIARDPNLGAPVAVQSVTAEDIQLSGSVELVEVVREIPALMTSETGDNSAGVFASAFDSNDSSIFTLAGEQVLQLRGMGISRTLVLVDGRRHVPGSPGNAVVDINTIPQALVERVEVLTGGASAIYGADAVTGVVNFILKDDFEGLEINARGGISGEGDGEDYGISATWGTNFAGDRGNFAVAVEYRDRSGLRQGDRDWSANNAIWWDRAHPDLRFQAGDIDTNLAGPTPLFAEFFSTNNGFYPWGFVIPTADDFVADYNAAFGAGITTGDLSAAELALIDRAANSPRRRIGPFATFSISSEGGVVVPADYAAPGALGDLNGNGTDDCLETFTGYNSLFDFSPPGFGALGGCWHVDQGGVVRTYNEGLIAGDLNQFGGDGVHAIGYSPYSLTPDDKKINLNLLGRYDVADDLSVFAEFKFVTQETETFDSADGFYDLLFVAPDNPFIPAALQPIANAAGGLRVTRDPNDFGRAGRLVEREMTRLVIGIEGAFDNGWTYEFSLNRGQTNIEDNNFGNTIMDRYFAALDVVDDGSGNPICRSEFDGSPAPDTQFNIPPFDFGFFTFNPMDGSCQPYNILNGPDSGSQAAIDWMTTTVVHHMDVEQTVFQGLIGGDLPYGLDAGDIAFAGGTEFRVEKSAIIFDPLTLGECPVTTPDCFEGQLVRELGLSQNSLVFDPEFLANNSDGTYDVWEVFGEVDVPLIAGRSFAEELTFSAAARFSQYSNVGDTFTWQSGLVWSPVEDIRFRGTVSQAVRAPNIAELFNPELAATFRPNDPCEQTTIDALPAAQAQIRQANCLADGIPMGFQDPLSARFSGVTSGNPDLKEETADTITLGFVFTPTFLEGFNMSVDYWDIQIEDAIEFVDDQNIVDNCYDAATFPNEFCANFTRNRDPASAQFLGFNFLRQTQLNFGKIESNGIDFTADYTFEVGGSTMEAGVQGTWVDELNQFFDPGDPTVVDPELGEIRRPELAGTAWLGFTLGPLYARWTSLYQDRQGLRNVEIETAAIDFGPAGFSDDFWSHNLSASYDLRDTLQIYGGINNVTDEEPFITQTAYPVGPRGRFFFLGVNWTM